MERLTERIDNAPDGESGVWVKNHDYVSAAEKLAEYEDLEERLNKVYGECDGLLESMIELLEEHSGVDVPDDTVKTLLLINESVDFYKKCESLEKQGRLIKLPCKVGDVVYVTEPTLVEAMCIRIQLDGYRNGIWINTKEYPCDSLWIPFDDFGKTVFLTKSEAEAKLKELRGNND